MRVPFSIAFACAVLPSCMSGGRGESTQQGSSNASDSGDGDTASEGAESGHAGCFCCSGSRGALDAGEVGDAGDCAWCPTLSKCVGFVGGGFQQTLPAYTCGTEVSDGGVGGPGISTCAP